MKKIQHIIIHLFLLGMLLSVFQYLPILEEETPGHRTELCKKAKGSDSTDNDDCEDDDVTDDDDNQTDLFFTHLAAYAFTLAAHNKFYLKDPIYTSLSANISTPPPKA